MKDTVTVTRDFPFPPSRIWRALTTGALLAEWLMPNDFEPVKGHRFTFRVPPMPHWDGLVAAEVLEITPETRLALAWEAGDLKTTLTFTLTPTDAGARLAVVQRGFREDQVQNAKGATWGWNHNLDRLAELLGKEG
jgi:uncharacterized protein YndB with AHSA1/START domain